METSVQARAAGTTGCQLQQTAADMGLFETKPSSKQHTHGRKQFISYTAAEKGPGQSI